jgi:arabinoxylan arabinofuranohydrolase
MTTCTSPILHRILFRLLFMTFIGSAWASPGATSMPHAVNPILPGYYADPSLVAHEGRFYLYATLDPWGGDTLGCWESPDFKHWTYRSLNWPTKAACTSLTSKDSKVWAPSVIRARDGRFFMYVSVGSEVWVGVAAHPLGPWRNALGDRPLIPSDYRPGYHMIDAEAFIDDDGTAYLYWGSGWKWVNGRCWVVKLQPDMTTFDGEVHDVTPSSYFEAPFMVKHAGRYYLMNSTGKTITDTYAVAYAVGDSPFGPFHDAPNNPILASNAATGVISPGHHTVFRHGDRTYMLYHRHGIPFDPAFIGRQICVDELKFTADGLIERVHPTHTGPDFARGRPDGRSNPATAAAVTASSARSASTPPAGVFDDNYAVDRRRRRCATLAPARPRRSACHRPPGTALRICLEDLCLCAGKFIRWPHLDSAGRSYPRPRWRIPGRDRSDRPCALPAPHLRGRTRHGAPRSLGMGRAALNRHRAAPRDASRLKPKENFADI